jgi:hypothetical protein
MVDEPYGFPADQSRIKQLPQLHCRTLCRLLIWGDH